MNQIVLPTNETSQPFHRLLRVQKPMLASFDKLACPVCMDTLHLTDKTLKCPNNHSYDIAREGYVNLLLAQHKQSKHPGDSKDMVLARKSFHHHQYYKPMVDSLADHIHENTSLLDVGCGEGSYITWLSHLKTNVEYYGVDISRHAIQQAAKRNTKATFIVASNWKLPFIEHGFDCVLTSFSPVSQPQLQRVLKKHGQWINITPGSNHLIELRQALYDDVSDIDKQTHYEQWHIDKTFSFTSTVMLNQSSIAALIEMTPYVWQANPERVNELKQHKEMSMSLDFNITIRSIC